MKKETVKRIVVAGVAGMMAATCLAGCGTSSSNDKDSSGAKGQVYYLNFKPEQDQAWQKLAK